MDSLVAMRLGGQQFWALAISLLQHCPSNPFAVVPFQPGGQIVVGSVDFGQSNTLQTVLQPGSDGNLPQTFAAPDPQIWPRSVSVTHTSGFKSSNGPMRYSAGPAPDPDC